MPSGHSMLPACTAAGRSRQRARSEGSDPQGATGRFSAAAGSPLLLCFATSRPPRRSLDSAPAPALQIPKSEAPSALVVREPPGRTCTPPWENFDQPLSVVLAGVRSPPSPPSRHHSTDISVQEVESAALQLRLLSFLACRNRTGFNREKKSS